MQRVREPNRLTVNADRAKALLEAIRRRIERGDQEHVQLKAEVFKAFTKYFTELAQPTLEPEPLLSLGIRDPEQYSEQISSVEADLTAAANDASNLAGSVVSAFNYSSILAKNLDNQVARVTSKSQDLQHLSDTFAEDTIVAGDDFVDESRMDPNAALEVPRVELPPSQASVTLKRQKSINVFKDKDVKIRVLSTFDIYEGCFYELQGKARPEGGVFHFSGPNNTLENDLSAPGAPPDLLRRFAAWRVDPSQPASIQTPDGVLDRTRVAAAEAVKWASKAGQWGPFSHSEWDMLARNFHFDPAFAFDQGLLNPKPQPALTDLGAPLSERNRIRKRMIDGNPDSFWECEYVVDTSEALGAQAPSDKPKTSAVEESLANVLIPGSSSVRTSKDVQDTGYQMTLGELIEKITSPAIDKLDLDCTIILELPDPVYINWINLVPHNFSDAAWLEVLDVSTSLDGAEWTEIDGLHNSKFENILTEDANKEMTPEETAVTMAPSRYQYRGQGVWSFPMRQVKMIRIKLLQRTPIPAPYDVIVLEMSQTVTSTRNAEKSWTLF